MVPLFVAKRDCPQSRITVSTEMVMNTRAVPRRRMYVCEHVTTAGGGNKTLDSQSRHARNLSRFCPSWPLTSSSTLRSVGAVRSSANRGRRNNIHGKDDFFPQISSFVDKINSSETFMPSGSLSWHFFSGALCVREHRQRIETPVQDQKRASR
jgi:hypothetical protein